MPCAVERDVLDSCPSPPTLYSTFTSRAYRPVNLDNKHHFCSPSITPQDRTTASPLFALLTNRRSHFYRCIDSLGIWTHKYPKYLPHSSTHHTTESSPLISNIPPSHNVKAPNISNKSCASALINIFRIIFIVLQKPRHTSL